MTSSKKGWHLFVDGASRGNPGPSGAGIYLSNNGVTIAKRGYFLGKHTNNEAEYLALLIGAFVAKKHMKEEVHLHVFSDSLLLIKQMKGEYRVRKPELIVLHQLVTTYFTGFECTFTHVYREKNVEADALANVGVDTKTSLPVSFISLLRTHNIHV